MIDISAAVIVMIITALICRGVEGSARTNTLMTGFNLLIIVFVIFVGAGEIEPRNWDPPFLPHGAAGVLRGAAVVFFAYIGFDACAPHPPPISRQASAVLDSMSAERLSGCLGQGDDSVARGGQP